MTRVSTASTAPTRPPDSTPTRRPRVGRQPGGPETGLGTIGRQSHTIPIAGRPGRTGRRPIQEELPLSTRVHELAKELGFKSQELLDRIQKWGLDVKASTLASLDPPMVDRIRQLMSSEPAAAASKAAPAPRPSSHRPAPVPSSGDARHQRSISDGLPARTRALGARTARRVATPEPSRRADPGRPVAPTAAPSPARPRRRALAAAGPAGPGPPSVRPAPAAASGRRPRRLRPRPAAPPRPRPVRRRADGPPRREAVRSRGHTPHRGTVGGGAARVPRRSGPPAQPEHAAAA